MTVKRYIAVKDSTITNVYQDGLKVRARESNMGSSDSLELFHMYGRASSEEQEISKILLEFPVDDIIKDRELELIPYSGSVNFVLKLSNAVHPYTLPKEFTILANPLSRSWKEGDGVDMESYKDIGPVNWISASNEEAWENEGGDYYTDIENSQYMKEGYEDLEMDVTDIVEQWITGSIPNYGFLIQISSSGEDDTRSYYTKKFFSRGSEYFFKRPWIEARFDASTKDDRGRFYMYSPFVPMELNYNTLYIHNVFKGGLYDFPTIGTGDIYLKMYETPNLPLPTQSLPLKTGSTLSPDTVYTMTGSWVSTGVYKADVAIDTTLENVYDIWFDNTDTPIGTGGGVKVQNPDRQQDFTKNKYAISIRNIKTVYYTKEDARFQLYIRQSNWNPNSYTEVTQQQENVIVDNIYYKVFRIVDNYEAIPFGTGSYNETRLSYDVNGNYFDLDMSLLEPGYSYGMKFTVYDSGQYFENKELFKFRVEE